MTVIGCGSTDNGALAAPPSVGGQAATGNGGSNTIGGSGSTQASKGGTTSSVGTGGASTTASNGGANTSNGGSNTTLGGSATTVGGSSTATGGASTTTAGGKATTGGAAAAGGSTVGTGGRATGGIATAGGTFATGGKAVGGTTPMGGGATGGASTTGGATTATGGAGTSVSQSSSCVIPTWPASVGTKSIGSSGITVAAGQVYDGAMALHDGSLNDCSTGDQDSTTAAITVGDGGTVKNVVFGKKIGDGIHCLGSCTIDNVWFPYICDDAITINKDAKSSGTSTISNSGFKGARDKTIQHNGGNSTVDIDNVYVEVAGKLYRSCGSGGGCTSGAKHTASISNVIAIGVNQVAGVSEDDKVTLKNICTFRTPSLCHTYKVGGNDDSTLSANKTAEGPGPSCSYTAADAHALVSKVGGTTLTTEVACPGSNAVKSGTSATACITGFESCLGVCSPGMYGFKQFSCSGGLYTSAASAGCAMVTAAADSAAAAGLAGTKASTATASVTKNDACSTQWAWAKDSASTTNYCACVEKPGYYQETTGSPQPATWIVWDCQAQWW